MKLSYDSTEIIEELREDIAEFGSSHPAYGIWKEFDIKLPLSEGKTKTSFCVNYLIGEEPPHGEEIEPDTIAIRTTLGDLLKVFVEQNNIF